MHKCPNCGKASTLEGECNLCGRMRNKAMARKVSTGEAIDLKDNPRNPEGDYVLQYFEEGKDYCDTHREAWIWSIGQQFGSRQILADTGYKFLHNPNFKCLWLR